MVSAPEFLSLAYSLGDGRIMNIQKMNRLPEDGRCHGVAREHGRQRVRHILCGGFGLQPSFRRLSILVPRRNNDGYRNQYEGTDYAEG